MAVRSQKAFAPGARVVVRDEEWIVRSVRSATYGGHAVRVAGTSELVRGKDSIFLTGLDDIQELRPEETELVHDESPRYRRSRLYLESLLRRTPPTDAAVHTGHRAAIRRTDYQLQPAAKALQQLRPRILMADGVGLGKTIEVGILLSELIQRGRGGRILVVALKSILAQFQEELWARFTIPLVRLDSVGVERVQSRVPSSMNPFYYFDRVIISIDTLKKDAKYRRYLEQCHWDVVVVDECQNVAVRKTGGRAGKSQRARLAQLLARTCDALILTSATPHDGRPESFASLMNLLEPTAVADESEYSSEDVQEYFLRRFKKDVAHQIEEVFPERELELRKEPASPAEEAVFAALSELELETIARGRGGKGILFRTLLLKAFLSSPAACASTIEKRLGHKDMQAPEDSAVRHDRQALEGLLSLVERVRPRDFGKLLRLLAELRELGIGRRGSRERVVIFSERIATLRFLEEELAQELGLGEDQIEIFHGSLDDQKQQGLVRSFGTEKSPVRVLLASDVASEGINLHYFCHHMVHFDLPWSLITLEQRNGRIDRFGQRETPRITYLLTVPGDPGLKGDLRVLERLIEKEDNAHKNLGDVAWLMDLHDAEREEERIARGIERGETPEAVIPEQERPTDFLALMRAEPESEPAPEVTEPLRLYDGDLAYAREAFAEVLDGEPDAVEWHDHLDGFTLRPPEDLARRFDYLPRELQDGRREVKLTVDRQRVMDALEASREEQGRWPEWQLFWQQHPIAEWLDDRVLAGFGSHEAPVVRVARGLEAGDCVMVFEGVVSNHRSQPTIVEWFGVPFADGEAGEVASLADWLEWTGLAAASNPGGGLTESLKAELDALRRPAVELAREHMLQLRNERSIELGESLRTGMRRLARWRGGALELVAAARRASAAKGRKLRSDQRRRLENREAEVDAVYQARRTWIKEVMRTVPEPYLRLALVLIPQEAT